MNMITYDVHVTYTDHGTAVFRDIERFDDAVSTAHKMARQPGAIAVRVEKIERTDLWVWGL